MTRREILSWYRAAVLGVDLPGRTHACAAGVLRRLRPGRIAIVAAGKSAGPMADATVRAIRRTTARLLRCVVVAPDGGLAARSLPTMRAAHPIPDARSFAAGRAALALAGDLRAGDLLLVLVSGGASAVLAAPRPGVRLRDKRALAARLLRSGRTIHEVNRARARLSSLKAGGLLRAAGPAEVLSIVASDVTGDDPDVVGSGPAAGAPAILVATPRTLLLSVLEVARRRGHSPRELPDASEPVGRLAERYGEVRGLGVAVGEPTLRVRGEAPGGRSQHLALWVARGIAGRRGARFLAAGSDGRDGPTEAAGACVDGETWNHAKSLGIAPDEALLSFTATPLLRALGATVGRWKSPTNLQDVHIIAAPS